MCKCHGAETVFPKNKVIFYGTGKEKRAIIERERRGKQYFRDRKEAGGEAISRAEVGCMLEESPSEGWLLREKKARQRESRIDGEA